MERIITVRGVGTAKTAPDLVRINFMLSSKNKKYGKAVEASSDQIGELGKAVRAAGFEEKELKTTYFNVQPDYEGYTDEKGNYRNVFAGYVVNHHLSFSFPFDTDKLLAVLTCVSECSANPNMNIVFTVSDPAAVKNALLASAAENALAKAKVLAAASGVKLGKLINIDYNWGHVNVNSRTTLDCGCEEDCAAPMSAKRSLSFGAGGFTHEDIESSDSAAFTWEIVE